MEQALAPTCPPGTEPLQECRTAPWVNAQFTILRDPGRAVEEGLAMSIRRESRAIARGANPGAALILGTLLLLTCP